MKGILENELENVVFQTIYESLTRKAMQCFETANRLSSEKNLSLVFHYDDQAFAYLDSLMDVASSFEANDQIALETYKECEYMVCGDLRKKIRNSGNPGGC